MLASYAVVVSVQVVRVQWVSQQDSLCLCLANLTTVHVLVRVRSRRRIVAIIIAVVRVPVVTVVRGRIIDAGDVGVDLVRVGTPSSSTNLETSSSLTAPPTSTAATTTAAYTATMTTFATTAAPLERGLDILATLLRSTSTGLL